MEVPLVIADQIMPGMKGDALLIDLHTRYPEMIKVMLTGQARAEDVGNVVNRGDLYRFLAKPWNETDLVLTVTEALRRYRQDQQLRQQGIALEQTNRELEMLNADLERQVQERTQELRWNEQQLRLLNEELEQRVQTQTEKLQTSRTMLQLVLDTIPQRVFWKDRESRFLGCNPAFARDARLPPEAIIGKTDLDFPWADRAPLYRAEDAQVIATQTAKLDYEEQITNAQGEQRWLRTSKIPLTNGQGTVIGVLGCYEDITARKQAKQQLQNERLRLQLALEAAAMGTWVCHWSLGTLTWSERTEEIFGFAPGTFPGDRDSFLTMVDDQDSGDPDHQSHHRHRRALPD
ncbi:MAG: PAS domain-containing protein [Leptolyngbyaceae cyanobacterium SM2_3_12]|nr:PAS domain-containing protein [Leptolyngbyaceae cyanobacterium SM2_3_12]